MDRVAVLDVEHGVTYAETLPQLAAGNRKGAEIARAHRRDQIHEQDDC